MRARLARGPFAHCRVVAALCLLGLGYPASAQTSDESLIKDLQWRNIGNANQKGRIASIDALQKDWTHVIVGTASGGVFKSLNGGTTWTPIFDTYGAASIGVVRLFQPNPNIIWVGTGEFAGRNSAAWGDGVYKSTDGGKTFQHMGLRDTYTTGGILTHPSDPNIVYVAALGCIWGPVGDRGLFKTIDGGKTWTKLTNGLPNDYTKTGAQDLVMDPTDPNTIYVSFWQRRRFPWKLVSGGPNGGIFKSTDGGQSFTKLTKGLPVGDSGKIGLAIAPKNPKVLMAHYEHGFHPAKNDPAYGDMTKLGSGIYRSEDGGASWQYMNRYFSRPFYYNYVAISPHDDKLTYHYNQNFQYSTNGGKTFQSFGNTGGGHCWHAIWLDPHNKNRFYTGSDGGVTLTQDHGKSWVAFKNINATQYYMLGVDMRDPYYVYGGLQDAGTSGGPSQTRARGIYLDEWYNVQGGDGYHVQIDPLDWRTVYTGQDPRGAGTEVSRSNVELRTRKDVRPWKGANIVNYDQYITPEIEAMQRKQGWGDAPKPGTTFNYRTAGSGAFRWNWSTPIVMSPHNPHTVFVGANHLFKTIDRGEHWYIISPDLSKNIPEQTKKGSGGLTDDTEPGGGAETHGTIITISQSPLNQQVIWVGTDDGNVQVTRDGAATWKNVALTIPGLPQPDMWVSRVEASYFDPAVCYVSIDGHRSAQFKPWVFKTSDYGATWKSISSNLPDGQPVYVVKQDRKNPKLLFAGTEFAIYFSVNDGEKWTRLNRNLPTVAVHDIVVHPRDPDLVIGTHGRGIWIMDDISALQQLTPKVLASEAHLFKNEVATQWVLQEPQHNGGAYAFIGENPTRNAVINYYLGPTAKGEVAIEIADPGSQRTRKFTFNAAPGLGQLEWDMRFTGGAGGMGGKGFGKKGGGGAFGGKGGGGPLTEPGTYRVTMTVNGKSYVGSITLRADPLIARN